MKKIAYMLYRVSSKKQLYKSDDNKDDIPMQRQACREYAERMGWEIGREFEEKAVSGSKVSAAKRDAVIDLKDAALKGEFQILLVFLFDRLGRIDDETPFVVEWFVKHGIECWSVHEGQQKIEQHTDKLTNYIRFWQAAGESEKTSIRTKERLGQIVEQGYFRGGTEPYGYRLEKQGRLNKLRHELYEIMVDEQEAAVVRLIFDLACTQGYGTQRIANHLTGQGIKTRKGDNFTNCTVLHMLRNRAYLGILRSGARESPVLPELRIVLPEVFEAAQAQLDQRSAKYRESRSIPLNTTGSSLLSGNVFCGHCGARLTVTTNGKKRVNKDGEVTVTPRTRYVCYNKTRHKHKCDGQTGYTAKKLDGIIDGVVRNLFDRIGGLPKESVIEERYAGQISALEMQLASAKAFFSARSAEVEEYESEVLRIIRGESKLNAELLNKLHEEAKEKADEAGAAVKRTEERLRNSGQMKAALSQQFDNIKTWSDMYDGCGIEAKKMILSRMMTAVRVRRNYEVEIDLTVACEELGICLDEAENAASALNKSA